MPEFSDDDLEADAFELSLDEMLDRVSAATRAEWEEIAAPAPRTARPPLPPRTGAEASTPAGRSMHRFAWPLLALLAVGGGAIWQARRDVPRAAAPVSYDKLPPPAAGRHEAASSPDTAPVAQAPPLRALVDADASTEALMVAQLHRAGGAAGEAAAPSQSASAPTFAIARYDTLPTAWPAWRVVAPLNVEAVYALVPAGSPMRELGDLRGRRINVGAPGSARALSGEALYRTLFEQPLPPSPWRSASRDAALQALLDGNGLDALVLFDGQPSAWLASLPAGTRGRLKVLRLPATGAAARKALQAYLPASVEPGLANDPAPVATLGEVAFLVASPDAVRPAQAARDLCERLPELRAHGHPAWREVDPTVRLPLNARRASELEPALQACRATRPLVTSTASPPGAQP